MATTLYLRNSASSAATTGYTGTKKELLSARGAAATSQVDNTISSLGITAAQIIGRTTTDDLSSGGIPAGSTGIIWISNRLAAVSLNSSITLNLRRAESNAMANYGSYAVLYKLLADGSSTGLTSGQNTTELGTSEAVHSITLANPFASLSDGDRLALVVAYIAGGGTSASGFTATTWWDGPTSAASGDAFITFNETLTDYVATTPSGLFIPKRRVQHLVR